MTVALFLLPPPCSPREIKTLAQRDPDAAYSALYLWLFEPITYHVLKIVKDYVVAQDIAQETFIRATQERRLFNPNFNMRAWLYRVAVNQAFNYVRDRKRRTAILSDNLREFTPAASPDCDKRIDETMARTLLALYIARLTPAHRQIMRLRHVRDLTYEEIRKELGLPKIGTVMSRLSRGKDKLILLLERDGLSAEDFAL